jgi:hypothetical protein
MRRREPRTHQLISRAAVQRLAAAGLAALIACSSPAAAQPATSDDARVQHTLRLLAARHRCSAHRSLAWLRARFPHGIFPGDDAFVHRRYADAFTAWRALIDATRLDEAAENERLRHVATLAGSGAYRAAIEASRQLQAADDLTDLITGGLFFASGNSGGAEGTWIAGVGAHSVPGGSSPYVGASLSILFVLDGTLLAHACATK